MNKHSRSNRKGSLSAANLSQNESFQRLSKEDQTGVTLLTHEITLQERQTQINGLKDLVTRQAARIDELEHRLDCVEKRVGCIPNSTGGQNTPPQESEENESSREEVSRLIASLRSEQPTTGQTNSPGARSTDHHDGDRRKEQNDRA